MPVARVLVLPGWWIETNGARGAVRILSGRNVAKAFEKFPEDTLTEDDVQRITDRIESHCRDIDIAA